MKAFVFPGQGAQFPGMGKDLYETNAEVHALLDKANEVLGFGITDIMFDGTAEELRQTRVTQPAVFLHSVAVAMALGSEFQPDMVGGHSLGEFSALVAAGALTVEAGLRLVSARAMAMQKACELQPSTMAAVMGLDTATIERICAEVNEEVGVVVPANYNTPAQLVISGTVEAVQEACQRLKAAGAKRALPLAVGGAFHSPLMMPAQEELRAAIDATELTVPRCPVYQNVDGQAHTNPDEIRRNLVAQLTAGVRWTEEVQHMREAGATEFVECGPGKALTGMIAKILPPADDLVVRTAW